LGAEAVGTRGEERRRGELRELRELRKRREKRLGI
jgi:hypothetical protein